MRPNTLMLLLLALLVVPACGFDSVEPAERLEWEANVERADDEEMLGFNGTVSMIADFGMTEMWVELEDAVEGTQFGWRIRIGTCDDPGELIAPEAAFADFAIDEAGEGSVSRVPLVGQLRGDLEYFAQIHHAVEDAGDALACRPMEQIE